MSRHPGGSGIGTRSGSDGEVQRPLVVELTGPAGAGKSTLRQALLERDLGMRWVPLVPRSRLAPVYARQVVELLPTYLWRYRATPWFTRKQAKAMALLEAWRKDLDRWPATDGQTLLLDQGPVFRLAVLSEFGPPVSESEPFQRMLDRWMGLWCQRIDLIVWLSAPGDVLLHRVRTRPQDHAVKRWPADPALARIRRYEMAIDRTIERVALPGRVAVLRFESDRRTPAEMADEVLGTLERERRRRG